MLYERFCDPYLPHNRVKRVFVSGLMPEYLLNELRDMMIVPYIMGKSHNMTGELAYHPDILINNIQKGSWLTEHDPRYIPQEFPYKMIFESETELQDLYPYDCPFNNFRIAHALVCGKNVDYMIRSFAEYEDRLIIYVPQGYTKCCTILVNERAVITSDPTIHRIMRKHGFDVLRIEDSTDIGLKGYSCGMIGGCAGKISEDLIVFTGNLNTYKYGEDIKDFCRNYKVECMSLTYEPMYDYGGILPITEFTHNADEDVSELFNKKIT